MGRTPLALENIKPGDHKLRIELSGYQSEELIIPVKPGDEGSAHFIRLDPISSTPTPTASPTATRSESSSVAQTSPSVSPVQSQSPYASERYPQTRERWLTETDVANLNYAELRYAINEMYARCGAPFASEPDIHRQFAAFPWYHPNKDIKLSQIEAAFSPIEKHNLDLLARLRDQKRPK